MKVLKRNGDIVLFDKNKIAKAVNSAIIEVDGTIVNHALSEKIADNIEAKISKSNSIPTVEYIQDLVELELMRSERPDVAKAYICYREKRERVRNKKETILDYKNLVESYVNVDDWRVKENSTVTYSVGGLILSNSGAITANYWLSEVYDDEIADAHRNADIHIHDLSMLTGYCAGWSLKQLIQEGLGGITGKITSAPPKHLTTLCNQMVNFLGIMQNEWAGAQAFSSFDTYLSAFVKADNLSYEQVKKAIESFIYGVNTPSRWGTQAPFTNITLDWTVPADLADLPCIVGGKEMGFKYKDCQKEMDMVNRAFIEIMVEGDANGRGFQYPIPTYSITRDFDWSETENNKLLFEMTAKYGTPYFSNYINSDMEPSDVRSMCPLTGDTKIPVLVTEDICEVMSIYEAYLLQNNYTNMKVYTPNGWKKITFNAQPMTKVYRITMSNNTYVCMGENHLQPTKAGTMKAKDLAVGDLLPFYSDTEPYEYHSITSIEEIECKDKNLYCGEVDDDSHIFMLANELFTHNCRLRLDLRELRKKSGGFFGSGESTGSVGVVTINLPRIAFLAQDEEDFYKRLGKMMDIAARSLKIKRRVITEFLEGGLYPYTKHYLGTFDNHFSTIGLIGMNEVGLNAKWLRKDLTHKETQQFAKEVLNFMRERLSDYQEAYGDLYNLEATPAESTTYRLAKHDKKRYPSIITANDDSGVYYYTNSSHLPVGYTEDIFEALDIQDELQTLYTSGTVFHAFLGEKLPNWKGAADLVKKIAENYSLPYYTLSPTYSVCKAHGYLAGEVKNCSVCGEVTETYSRITGYYRPVQNWNDGKAQEYKDRKLYNVEKKAKGNMLFTTETCPNCPIAKEALKSAGIEFTLIDAVKEADKAIEFDVRQAPTLLVYEEDKYVPYTGLSAIRRYAQQH